LDLVKESDNEQDMKLPKLKTNEDEDFLKNYYKNKNDDFLIKLKEKKLHKLKEEFMKIEVKIIIFFIIKLS
jgi:hypothetical protein